MDKKIYTNTYQKKKETRLEKFRARVHKSTVGKAKKEADEEVVET